MLHEPSIMPIIKKSERMSQAIFVYLRQSLLFWHPTRSGYYAILYSFVTIIPSVDFYKQFSKHLPALLHRLLLQYHPKFCALSCFTVYRNGTAMQFDDTFYHGKP